MAARILRSVVKIVRSARFAALTLAGLFLVAGCAGGTGSESDELQIAHVHGMGVDGDMLYVATHHGLYVHDGETWTQRSEDKADHMGFSLASPSLAFRSGHPETGGNLGVQRSTDGGATWSLVSNVLDVPVDFHAMAAERDSRPALYGWSQGLFRSLRDPERWEPVDADGLPRAVGALGVGEDGVVFASASGGVYRSKDEGETWKQVSNESVFALAAATDADIVYAAKAEGTGVMRSTDGGKEWTDVSDGLGASGVIVALGTSSDGRTVVAADQEGGIWMSEDRGGSWTRVPPS